MGTKYTVLNDGAVIPFHMFDWEGEYNEVYFIATNGRRLPECYDSDEIFAYMHASYRIGDTGYYLHQLAYVLSEDNEWHEPLYRKMRLDDTPLVLEINNLNTVREDVEYDDNFRYLFYTVRNSDIILLSEEERSGVFREMLINASCEQLDCRDACIDDIYNAVRSCGVPKGVMKTIITLISSQVSYLGL